MSLVATGLFFVLIPYTQVLGFIGYQTTLDKVDAPLNIPAEMMNVAFLKAPISAAQWSASFLSVVLPELRREDSKSHGAPRVFHSALGNAHERNETHHVAVTIVAAFYLS